MDILIIWDPQMKEYQHQTLWPSACSEGSCSMRPWRNWTRQTDPRFWKGHHLHHPLPSCCSISLCRRFMKIPYPPFHYHDWSIFTCWILLVAGGHLLKTHDIHGSLKHPLDPLEAPLPASTGRRELWALHLPARPQLEKSPLWLLGVMGMFRPWVANFDCN